MRRDAARRRGQHTADVLYGESDGGRAISRRRGPEDCPLVGREGYDSILLLERSMPRRALVLGRHDEGWRQLTAGSSIALGRKERVLSKTSLFFLDHVAALHSERVDRYLEASVPGSGSASGFPPKTVYILVSPPSQVFVHEPGRDIMVAITPLPPAPLAPGAVSLSSWWRPSSLASTGPGENARADGAGSLSLCSVWEISPKNVSK